MKCPLLSIKDPYSAQHPPAPEYDCLKEECAWWNNTIGLCAVLQLSKSTYYAGLHIPGIEAKLDKGGKP